jgi:hypothetical protein
MRKAAMIKFHPLQDVRKGEAAGTGSQDTQGFRGTASQSFRAQECARHTDSRDPHHSQIARQGGHRRVFANARLLTKCHGTSLNYRVTTLQYRHLGHVRTAPHNGGF